MYLDDDNVCPLCADNYDQEHHLGQYAIDEDDSDYEAERCQFCDSSLDTELEQKTGTCVNCYHAPF